MDTNDFNYLVECATKAPSGHNTQAWKFEKIQDGIIIHPDFTRALPIVDSDNHALYISLGCALENLVIAASKIGYKSIVDYPNNPNSSITIKLHLSGEINPSDEELFDFIKSRQVNRSKYTDKMVNNTELERLRNCFNYDGISLVLLNGKENFEKVIPLIIEANNMQFQNKQFVSELTDWFRYSKAEAEKTKDGLWTATMGLPSMWRFIGNFVMKNIVSAKSEAKRINEILQHTAGIAIFFSEKNDVTSWINVGRAFQRFGLTATKLSLCHAHLNMPCEEISVRQKLANLLELGDKHPLLLIRYGYAEKMPYSFRRNVEDVTVN
ncbi:MAG: hypothetical protein N3A67_05125 [Ignavibacteria bacterium]|nr:hypothetical protein [Ignavibacteria bacterium]